MRRVLLIFTFIILILVVIIGGLAFLAEKHPLMPGDGLYQLQRFAERIQEIMVVDATDKADLLLDLAGRRNQDIRLYRRPGAFVRQSKQPAFVGL